MSAITRRTVLEGIGSALVVTPFLPLVGCEADPPGVPAIDAGVGLDAAPTDTGHDGGAGLDGGNPEDTGASDAGESDAAEADAADPDAGETDSGDAGIVTGWATGGTASMTGNYPDP